MSTWHCRNLPYSFTISFAVLSFFIGYFPIWLILSHSFWSEFLLVISIQSWIIFSFIVEKKAVDWFWNGIIGSVLNWIWHWLPQSTHMTTLFARLQRWQHWVTAIDFFGVIVEGTDSCMRCWVLFINVEISASWFFWFRRSTFAPRTFRSLPLLRNIISLFLISQCHDIQYLLLQKHLSELFAQVMLNSGSLFQHNLPFVFHKNIFLNLRLVFILLLCFVVNFYVLTRKVVAEVVLVALLDLEVDYLVPEYASVVALGLYDGSRHHGPVVVVIQTVLYGDQVTLLFYLGVLYWVSENAIVFKVAFLTSVKDNVWVQLSILVLKIDIFCILLIIIQCKRLFFICLGILFVNALKLNRWVLVTCPFRLLKKLVLVRDHIGHDSPELFDRSRFLANLILLLVTSKLGMHKGSLRHLLALLNRHRSRLPLLLLLLLKLFLLLPNPPSPLYSPLLLISMLTHLPKHTLDLLDDIPRHKIRLLLQLRFKFGPQ